MAIQTELFDLPKTERESLTFKPFRRAIWTENKAQLIARYLRYFVLVTHHGTYIDGFAGPQESNKPDSWAAKLVLESEPRWLRHLFLCDSDASKVEHLRKLISEQPPRRAKEPKRRIEVFEGDFNQVVPTILESPSVGERVATFCLLDQRTFECHWSTVQALAEHKKGTKIELFYFFGSGWIDRALAGLKKNKEVADRWWGRDDWSALRDLKAYKKAELVRRRFESELNYKWARAWPIFERESGGGRVMYHMIHATDHPVAPHLMARAYRTAVRAAEPIEQLRLEFDKWKSG